MRHRSARRLLPQLLDRTLPPERERELRAHAAGCSRCEAHLAELELCDRLVARIPLALLPRAAEAGDERRLRALARWAFPRRPAPSRLRAGMGAAALAATAATLAGVVALAGASSWVPTPEPGPDAATQVAFVVPAAGR